MSPDLIELLGVLQVDTHVLRPGMSLEEAGLDSLALAELSMILAERGSQISPDEMAAAPSVEALERIVLAHLPAR